MKKTSKNDLSSLNDRHINYNGKNYIYSDFFTKKTGYIIYNSDLQKYSLFASRYIIGITGGILVFVFLKKPLVSIIIALAIYLFLEISFRLTFFKNRISIENYEKPKGKSYISVLTENNSTKKLFLILIIGIVIAVLIPINISQNTYSGLMLYANYAIFVGILIYLILVVCAIVSKFKNN